VGEGWARGGRGVGEKFTSKIGFPLLQLRKQIIVSCFCDVVVKQKMKNARVSLLIYIHTYIHTDIHMYYTYTHTHTHTHTPINTFRYIFLPTPRTRPP
jgi:hypothetical protein